MSSTISRAIGLLNVNVCCFATWQEVVEAVKRKRHREVLEKELEKRKLRRTMLGLRFHLRDLVGAGALARVTTTVGTLLRLTQPG